MQETHPRLIRPTHFLTAVQNNDPEALVLAQRTLDMDLRLSILLASWHGHKDLLKSLVKLYETKHDGRQDRSLYGEALAEASQNNHWEIVEFLLQNNADASFVYHTPLVEALKAQANECVTILLNHVNPQQINEGLIQAVVQSGHQSAFQMLLSHIPSLHCSSSDLIGHAVECGKSFMVEAVAQHMPDFTPYQERGFIPSVVRALEKNDDISLNIFIEFLHEKTLDQAHEKIIDFAQRKHFKTMREAHLSNKRMREQLPTIVEQSHEVRVRKM